MFPAATAAPFARNVVRRGIFGHFSLSFHVLLSFLTVYHGIRDGSWGYGLLSPGGSKTRYGSARGLPRMPVRSLPVRHVLIGSLTFLTFWSRSDTFLTFCQGFLRMKLGHRSALEHVCAHDMKRRHPKQDSAEGSQWWAPSHPPKSGDDPGAALLLAGASSSASSCSLRFRFQFGYLVRSSNPDRPLP